MLKYRKLTDLTDEEIKFAINDIIHPESIGEIEIGLPQSHWL